MAANLTVWECVIEQIALTMCRLRLCDESMGPG